MWPYKIPVAPPVLFDIIVSVLAACSRELPEVRVRVQTGQGQSLPSSGGNLRCNNDANSMEAAPGVYDVEANEGFISLLQATAKEARRSKVHNGGIGQHGRHKNAGHVEGQTSAHQ